MGTLARATAASASSSASDAYVMRYPDVAGGVHISALDAGSLMRFVNHAPVGDARNNCTVW